MALVVVSLVTATVVMFVTLAVTLMVVAVVRGLRFWVGLPLIVSLSAV